MQKEKKMPQNAREALIKVFFSFFLLIQKIFVKDRQKKDT